MRTAKRRKKLRSGEQLRKRLIEWCEARGGHRVSEPFEHEGRVIGGGDYELDTSIGKWIVHLPGDDDDGFGFDINTRFVDWPEGKLPSGANPYSGKWNWSCVVDEDYLFNIFTKAAAVYVTEKDATSGADRR